MQHNRNRSRRFGCRYDGSVLISYARFVILCGWIVQFWRDSFFHTDRKENQQQCLVVDCALGSFLVRRFLWRHVFSPPHSRTANCRRSDVDSQPPSHCACLCAEQRLRAVSNILHLLPPPRSIATRLSELSGKVQRKSCTVSGIKCRWYVQSHVHSLFPRFALDVGLKLQHVRSQK